MSCALLNLLSLSHISLYKQPVIVMIILPCFIVALLAKFQKQPPRYLNSFIIYISVTIAVEIIAWWYSLHRINNLKYYNYYAIINFTYLIFLLRSFLSTPRFIRLLGWGMAIYPVIGLLNLFLIQGTHTFNTYTFMLGCLVVVISCICYFYERIKFPGPHSLLQDPTFWIATGLLFFYTCSLPLNGILRFISNMPWYVFKTLYVTNIMINIILYLFFSISFICNRIFRKSSL
jgi:hypothetical protein